MSDNNDLRKALIARRNNLHPEYRQQSEALINQRIITLIEIYRPTTIAAYLAIAGEVSLQPLINYLHAHQIKLVLPCIDQPQHGDMTFALWQPQHSLHTAAFGVTQPSIHNDNSMTSQSIDIAIVPLLGFNDTCYRIGWGKGYYDRYFAYKQQQFIEAPQLIGAAFACQQDNTIPINDWDIRLNMVITENTIFA